MVDVLNALTRPSSMLRTSGTLSTKRKKYKEGTKSFNEKELGCFTSKYFECNDNMVARFSSEKQKEYLSIAAKIAEKSPMYPHKHGAIILYKDKIIASGYNYYMGDFSIHAEVAAISKIKKKQKHILRDCDIYVVRIGPKSFNNPLKYSRPCPNCQDTIIKNNIKNAYYSTSYEYDNIRSTIHKKNECECVFS
jgi:deoxycytidylate deaminase